LTSFMTPFDTLTEHFLYKKPLNKQRSITILPFMLAIFFQFFSQKIKIHSISTAFKENSRDSRKSEIKQRKYGVLKIQKDSIQQVFF